MKKYGRYPVSKVETNDLLIEQSKERKDILCRVVIIPDDLSDDNLSDEEKELLSQCTEKEREIAQKGALKREISCVTRVSNFVDGLDDLNEEDLDEETQKDFVSQLSELLKAKNENNETRKYIFTIFSFSVSELLKDTEYDGTNVLFDEDGNAIRSRNNLYFSFFKDDEEAFRFMQSRLIADIDENERLFVSNPTAKQNEKKEETKRRITLK